MATKASITYRHQVADIIASKSRASSYRPQGVLDLRIVNRRMPGSLDVLHPMERIQLSAIFDPDPLPRALASDEDCIEVAEVIDDSGDLRYRLYGWNYGVGCLFAPNALELVAFAAQHDMEHWNSTQRDLYYAMDRALGAGDHGFEQPLCFCWWRDTCWDAVANATPGTVGSDPYFRAKLAKLQN